ncbi:hypothetical protein [Thauera linaloolentis]|uniref:YtxH domain-containing protein n=1 Tax=Thauera linaloolentis (strain DSM 12138 / JCM 21573 / CCUG 41526 / CIP 105981 / IAM 15112 / NBRC 102519 / 47Lol) TaxID=1123367 RepID=N6Z1Z5_THAL4|nr:hypothetical protein [Thauera linaloolentis]ENO88637.1 hypothetical protein C666_08240 [Thauera linaloolentis 47Lol = DSM 12138]MCM8565682.1 hypothetical protein [Thauera linaloolentis]
MAKKHRKHRGNGGRATQDGAYQAPGGPSPYAQYGTMGGMAADAGFAQGFAQGMGQNAYGTAVPPQQPAGLDGGLLQGMPAFLRTGNTEQFLLGALIGAAAAWVLSDEELRGKIVKSAMKLYTGVAGGFEEMKEQMADIRAEVEAERHGDA